MGFNRDETEITEIFGAPSRRWPFLAFLAPAFAGLAFAAALTWRPAAGGLDLMFAAFATAFSLLVPPLPVAALAYGLRVRGAAVAYANILATSRSFMAATTSCLAGISMGGTFWVLRAVFLRDPTAYGTLLFGSVLFGGITLLCIVGTSVVIVRNFGLSMTTAVSIIATQGVVFAFVAHAADPRAASLTVAAVSFFLFCFCMHAQPRQARPQRKRFE